jgi:hypothetical protein
MSVTLEPTLESLPKFGARCYLLLFVVVAQLGVPNLSYLMWHEFSGTDAGRANYRDLGGRMVPQIQDEDVFYSNVGSSVSALKSADIVFLGPSFVSFAVDRATLQSSSALDRLKIYNMAFIGVRSGEFSRRVIKRWDVQAPLWIINVDDQVESFFTDNPGAEHRASQSSDRGC